MSISAFSNVFFSYDTQPLLADISFTCSADERICVVGPNSCGKTTLLHLASGELTPDSGTISFPHSAMPVADPEDTVQGFITKHCQAYYRLSSDFKRLSRALQEDPSDSVITEYDQVLAQMTAIGAWDLETRVATTLATLDLHLVERGRLLSSLSPGQVGRLRLAMTLVSCPEPLILDEPTNHLDARARAYLIKAVRSWDSAVLFTSHDRDFIDQCATSILDLDTAPWQALATASGSNLGNGIHQCAGNYSNYLLAKDQARRSHLEIYRHQQAHKEKTLRHQLRSQTVGHPDRPVQIESRMAKKFYGDRTQQVSTRRVTNDAKRLEALAQIEVRKPRDQAVKITIDQIPTPGAGIAIDIRQAQVPGRLQQVSFQLREGEHLLLTGENGCGKTTLLNWIHAGLAPSRLATGTVAKGWRSVKVDQQLPTPADELITPQVWNQGIGEAGKGFLHPKFWTTPIPDLSEGNQRRAQLALAFCAKPAILVVDEPTNYLDLDTLESLEQALLSWNGTLVVATHDQWLISAWQALGSEANSKHHWLHIPS